MLLDQETGDLWYQVSAIPNRWVCLPKSGKVFVGQLEPSHSPRKFTTVPDETVQVNYTITPPTYPYLEQDDAGHLFFTGVERTYRLYADNAGRYNVCLTNNSKPHTGRKKVLQGDIKGRVSSTGRHVALGPKQYAVIDVVRMGTQGFDFKLADSFHSRAVAPGLGVAYTWTDATGSRILPDVTAFLPLAPDC